MDKGFSLRGSFIIGPNGKLRHVTMNEPPVGRSVDEALRLVQAFQQVDTHGEVCYLDLRLFLKMIILRSTVFALFLNYLGLPNQLETW